MRRVKVLQIITGLGVGGAERVVLDLARSLDPAEFEVEVASLTNNTDALTVYGHPDLPVHTFAMTNYDARALFKLSKYIKEFRPDVVHAHMFHALVASLAIAGLSRVRLVFTSHCTTLPAQRAALVRLTRFRRAADILFIEGQHATLNARYAPVISNGVPVGQVARPRLLQGSSLRCISVGRVTDQKDPLALISAFAGAAIEGATLTMVGDGPLLGATRQCAQDLGIADRVKFLGVCDDVRGLLQSADLFLMHSKYEGLPLALLEAGAEGLPVISTPVGAIPSVLGGDRGFLVDSQEYVAVLRNIAVDFPHATQRGLNLHRYVKDHYSINAFVIAHGNLYRKLARDTRR